MKARRQGALALVIFVIAALTVPSMLASQGVGPRSAWSSGALLGLTSPLDDFGTAFKTGRHAGGYAQWDGSGSLLSVRAEVQYHQHDAKSYDVTWRTLATVFSAVFGDKERMGVAPYAIAGLGMYNLKASTTDEGTTYSADETKAGYSLGVGVRARLVRWTAFAETRAHSVSSSGNAVRFLPVSVGVSF